MTSDMTTDRTVHVAAFRPTFFAELFRATWYAHDGYAYANVAPIEPTVCHFRVPLSGGDVAVNSVDGTTWSDTGMHVSEFKFAGYVPDDDLGEIATYHIQTSSYASRDGYPLARF